MFDLVSACKRVTSSTWLKDSYCMFSLVYYCRIVQQLCLAIARPADRIGCVRLFRSVSVFLVDIVAGLNIDFHAAANLCLILQLLNRRVFLPGIGRVN